MKLSGYFLVKIENRPLTFSIEYQKLLPCSANLYMLKHIHICLQTLFSTPVTPHFLSRLIKASKKFERSVLIHRRRMTGRASKKSFCKFRMEKYDYGNILRFNRLSYYDDGLDTASEHPGRHRKHM